MKLSRRKLILGAGAGVAVAPSLLGHIADPNEVEADAVREDSLWTQQSARLPSYPTFSGSRSVDLAVIGGGYSGLSCAYYVKKMRPDWTVAVFDSHQIGSGASSRNTGALGARQIGVTDEGMLQRGLARLEAFIDEESIECDYGPVDTLMVHASEDAALEARQNIPAGGEWIEAADLERHIGSSYYFGATQTPGYNQVDPAKLVSGHANAATRVGVELFANSPVLEVNQGDPARLTLPNGEVRAKHVFVATNAYTPRLGLYKHDMFPLHQYTLATRKLTETEIGTFGLDKWPLRFEDRVLPVTFRLTPSGHFFVRMVLGFATHDSCVWKDQAGAEALACELFEQRYPGVSELDLTHGWHGVTGHTVGGKQIVETWGDGNIHISAAYNGLGIMPAHSSGYLTATRIVGEPDSDLRFLQNQSHIPFPGDFYRSLILKPFMNLLTPV